MVTRIKGGVMAPQAYKRGPRFIQRCAHRKHLELWLIVALSLAVYVGGNVGHGFRIGI